MTGAGRESDGAGMDGGVGRQRGSGGRTGQHQCEDGHARACRAIGIHSGVDGGLGLEPLTPHPEVELERGVTLRDSKVLDRAQAPLPPLATLLRCFGCLTDRMQVCCSTLKSIVLCVLIGISRGA